MDYYPYLCQRNNNQKQNTMTPLNNQLGNLIAEHIDLNKFFCVTFDQFGISLIGYYTKETEDYILSIGFEQYDYAHETDDTKNEYKKGSVRIVLAEKN